MLRLQSSPAPADETLFAEVVLPLAVKGSFTYRVPKALAELATEGKRVSVQFGKNKIYAGIITGLSTKPPAAYEAKLILDVLDEVPLIGWRSLSFWNWLAAYYMCTLGEVMKAALPKGLRLESETIISLSKNFDFVLSELSGKEKEVVAALQSRKELSIAELTTVLERKSVLTLVRSLFDKEVIEINEKLDPRYRAKTITVVALNEFYEDKANLQALFGDLEKSASQISLLQSYLHLNRNNQEVSKKALLELAGLKEHIFTALKKKGIFVTRQAPLSRLETNSISVPGALVLSPAQEEARRSILKSFKSRPVCLLHGITSSGKTEIYLTLIEPLIASGKQVLYLLPEIALTTQIIERLKSQFGEKVGLYHSRMSEMERVEVWQKTSSGEYSVLLGARSAIFLPFTTLGLIIVDEEHESSFKQCDPAPRYQARDAAIYLAGLYKVPTLLGSATPSLESYFQSETGKYGRVELFERYGGVQSPDIDLIDLRIAVKRNEMNGHFSKPLLEAMEESKQAQHQAILFQNRRGYSPYMLCSVCGHVERCINCDVSLTYHKNQRKLVCHYCGFSMDPSLQCQVCGNLSMDDKGLGTEKIEEEIKALLPGSRVARMDFDTTRTRHAYENILDEMEKGRIDFLVGTQMVSRGLDFANVNLTAILAADNMLNFPDFRAFERSFQLLTQVSGRAGRRNKRGKVYIQTYFPGHSILQQVKEQQYRAMYEAEVHERAVYHYPPYTRLIRIVLKHTDRTALEKASGIFAGFARPPFASMMIGPEDALVPRIRNWFIKHLLLKIDPVKSSVSEVKKKLLDIITMTYRDRLAKGLVIQIDVDPA